MNKNILAVLIFSLVIYILQFFMFPKIYSNVIGNGNEAIIVYCAITIVITVIGMIWYTDKMRYWLIGIIFYSILVLLYTPRGAYGIGISGIDLDGLQSSYISSERYLRIFLLVAMFFIMQISVLGVIKILKIFIKK